MRTQRKFPGTPFATSLRRPHGADKQWISSWWSLKNGSYVHVICDLPPGVLKTMCVSNVFVPFCALLSFAGVSEEHWKSNGFSTFFHHVLLLNCFGSCVVERKTLKRAGQLWRSGDWTPRQSSVEVGFLGVVWWQMGNQWKSHAVTSYNIAGTRFDQMGPKYSFWIIQDQNCCMGLGEKSQYSQLSFVFLVPHSLDFSRDTGPMWPSSSAQQRCNPSSNSHLWRHTTSPRTERSSASQDSEKDVEALWIALQNPLEA